MLTGGACTLHCIYISRHPDYKYFQGIKNEEKNSRCFKDLWKPCGKHALIFCQHSPSSLNDTVYLFTLDRLCHAHQVVSLHFAKQLICHILGVGTPKMGPMTLQFELSQDFCTMNIITNFHHHMINRSVVIVLTKKQTKRQTHPQTNFVENVNLAPLCHRNPSPNHDQHGKDWGV